MLEDGTQAKNDEPSDGFAVEAVLARLGEARLSKYLARAGHRALALALYEWNADIASALHFPMQQLEICLRNGIAAAVADYYGSDWWKDPTFKGLTPELGKNVASAEEKARENRNGFPFGADDFIAATSLGFWRELCKPIYMVHFFAKRIPIAFPHIPQNIKKADRLKAVHDRVDLLVKLRNRIAHHEPLLGSRYETVDRKLWDRHKDMMTLFDWMDSDIAAWIRRRDTFASVMARCPTRQA